ncbi:MAG: hypothetical protein WBN24_13235 [Acidimicrobiia bacterium]
MIRVNVAKRQTDPPGTANRSRSGGRRHRPWLTTAMAAILLAATLVIASSVGAPEAAAYVAEEANGKIAYYVSFQMSRNSLGTVDPDGSNREAIGGSHWAEGGPSWSPSGQKLAFSFFKGFIGPDNSGLGVVNADGTGVIEIFTTDRGAGKPAWSPSEYWLAFTMSNNPGSSLWKITINGTGLTQVLPDNVADPDWSPAGGQIAVSRQLPPDNAWQIVLITPGGGVLNTLASPNAQFVQARHPAWSPDATKIAFTGTDPAGHSGIWVMNADGSGATQLTEDGSEPEWSPNGALILYSGLGGPNVVPSTGGASMVLPKWEWEVYPRSQGGYDWQPIFRSPTAKHTTGLVNPSNGKWHLYDVAGILDTSFYYGNPGDYPFLGDWDCNGSETPGLYRQSDGYVYLRNANTQGIADIKFYFGNPGDVPIAGDFNGDGCDTVSIYRPSNQRFYIINALGANDGGLGAADLDYVFGDPGDKPFVGDFDGDGVETVGLHRESTGLVYFRNSHTQGNADNQFYFGDPGDRLIAGDWTGNGVFSPALFRPSNTTTYLRYTNTQGVADDDYIPITNDATWLPVSGHMN